MPRTSAATLRRKARGIERPVDPVLSEKRAAAVRRRWAKEKGKDPEVVERARAGGIAATAPVLNRGAEVVSAQAWMQRLYQQSELARARVHAKSTAGAEEAVDYLLRLVRAQGDCVDAPHQVRRLAALDILSIARVHGAGVTVGTDPDGRALNELSTEELHAILGQLQAPEPATITAEPEPTA
jgi:hypothetical protein